MKIIFIITSLTTGGAEMMLLKLLQHIDRSRFYPQVISLRTKGELGQRIEDLGIPLIALDMKPDFSNPFKILILIRELRKLKPDLVQTWMYHADLLGGIAARLAGCKQVVWGLRNSNLNEKLTKRSTLMVLKACALCSSWLPSRILSCSIRAAAVHADAGYCADKIHVIPNGFDLERFRPNDDAKLSVRLQLGLPPGTPLVGLIARLDPQKNHGGFIQAATIILSFLPNVHFVLAGGGEEANNVNLRKEIHEKGLSNCMHFLGQRDDVPRLIAALDILVSSSSYGEAFPNVLGEAMACEVPCVATDVGDSAEIVGEYGRVVQAGDMDGLAAHIVELLRLPPNTKSALGRQARVRVQTRYEIGRIARLYETFYEQLVKINFKGNA